jgi:hypothetical protein
LLSSCVFLFFKFWRDARRWRMFASGRKQPRSVILD